MALSKKKGKIDPFKTRKSKTTPAAVDDTISPPSEIAQAIDAFREAQEQAKHYEGEMTVHKDTILNYSQAQYSERLLNGQEKSFKILGEETMVTYVVMNSSAGLSEEDLEEFRQKWGDEAAEELITRDFGSIKFDPKVLEANYEQVVEALNQLSPDVLQNLFKPMLMKAVSGAAQAAKRYAKSPKKMAEMLQDLKIKNYIR